MDKKDLEESRARAREARKAINSGRIGDSYHSGRYTGAGSPKAQTAGEKKKDPAFLKTIITLLAVALVLGAAALWLILGSNEEIFVEKNVPDKAVGTPVNEAGLEIHYLDVGQGSCTLIKCDDEAMLIDGGPDAKGTFVQKYLNDQGIKKLKYLVGSHYDADHVGGLDVVIYKFDCETVFFPDYLRNDTKASRDIADVLKEKSLTPVHPVVGDSYKLGGGFFSFIGPLDGPLGTGSRDQNEYSLSLIFYYGDKSFIFTGDAPESSENEMLSGGSNLKADVYLAGHHGSSSSSSEAFLEAVKPDAAVISCGKDNDYGHPHDSVLKRFEKRGIKVYRTDLNGTVILRSDGKNIEFSTER